jgi:alpha-L-fucosidase
MQPTYRQLESIVYDLNKSLEYLNNSYKLAIEAEMVKKKANVNAPEMVAYRKSRDEASKAESRIRDAIEKVKNLGENDEPTRI